MHFKSVNINRVNTFSVSDQRALFEPSAVINAKANRVDQSTQWRTHKGRFMGFDPLTTIGRIFLDSEQIDE